jgi:hypothetical protein
MLRLVAIALFLGPFLGYVGSSGIYVYDAPVSSGPVAAEAIEMTNWSFASGAANFVLTSGLFASPAQGHIRVEDLAGGYVPSSAGTDVWDPAITNAGDSFTGMVVGHTYQFQYRAWTGTTGWESLPWLDLGTTWVQPNKSSAQETQSE